MVRNLSWGGCRTKKVVLHRALLCSCASGRDVKEKNNNVGNKSANL